MKIGKNRVIERSNLTSRFDNHDYDGDSIIAAAMHSEQAKYDFKYAFVKNLVEFEHLDELLIDYEHESIYSAYMLSYTAQMRAKDHQPIEIDTIYDLDRNIDLVENNLDQLYTIKEYNLTATYLEWLFQWCLIEPIVNHYAKYFGENDLKLTMGLFYNIERDGLLTKKNLTKLTEKYWGVIQEMNLSLVAENKEELNFWNGIHEFDKFLLECSGAVTFCSPTFELSDFVVDDPEIDAFKENLIDVEPYLAFHQNLVLFDKVKTNVEKNPDNILNLVFKSGARLKSVQLLKAASNTGIPTDIYGKAFPANIKNSLLDGLSPKEYFMTGDSARLALAQRQEAIPKGGELQRKFFFTIGILKLDKSADDCKTEKYYNILVKNKSHLKLLNHRWYRDSDGIEKKINIADEGLVGQFIDLRSPVTCKHKDYKICKRCFGDKIPDSINLGALTGAGLSEGIIQSVLRTHHFGGAFIATEDHKLLDIMKRSQFKAPDTIMGTKIDIEYIIEYLDKIYPNDEDATFHFDRLDPETVKDLTPEENLESFNNLSDGTQMKLRVEIHELPFNDDSVKVLNSIVSLIDKNRDASSLIDPSDLYNELEIVIEQNGILSTYLELIISLLYYDEDGILYRYTDKEPKTQVALKNIIEMLDPKLSIFYNFSNRVISKIYTKKGSAKVDHMYHDLLDIYR